MSNVMFSPQMGYTQPMPMTYPQQPQMGYPQQQMGYPQQPQPQVPHFDKAVLADSLGKFATQNATQHQNALTLHLYNTFSANQYQNPTFQNMANITTAMAMYMYQLAPGVPLNQTLNNVVTDAYDLACVLELQTAPGLAQQVPQPVIQNLLINLPRLQGIADNVFPMVSLQKRQLSIPGFQLANQVQPLFQPQQVNMLGFAPQPIQMGAPQQFGYPQQPIQMGMPSQGSSMGFNAFGQPITRENQGLSEARYVIPGISVEELFKGEIAPANVNTASPKALDGIPVVDMSKPAVGAYRAPLPPVTQPVATPPQFALQEPRRGGGFGVLSEFSTPNLEQAIAAQQRLAPGDIDFDAIDAFEEDEESPFVQNLNNHPLETPEAPVGGFSSFNELFGTRREPEPLLTTLPTPPAGIPVSPHSVGVTSGPALSEEGLPEGWLFTERVYQSGGSLLALLLKAKRNVKEPLPIGYDARRATGLYRYTPDGQIEQKIIGVTMDRAQHDLGALEEALAGNVIAENEFFKPLIVQTVDEANKVIKENAEDPQKIKEAFDETDLLISPKPVIASCPQEAALLTAARCAPLAEHNTARAGVEFYVREATALLTVANVKEFVEYEEIKALSQDSTVNNLLELASALKALRATELFSYSAMKKLTDRIRSTLNDVLAYDYGFADSVQLEATQPLEDELVEMILWLDQDEDHGGKDVLERIHRNWTVLRKRLCPIITGEPLASIQQVLARRYASEAELPDMLKVTANTVFMINNISITQSSKTVDELGIVDKDVAFVVKRSDLPYLFDLIQSAINRAGAQGAVYNDHRFVTKDGRTLHARIGRLGDGSTFVANYD